MSLLATSIRQFWLPGLNSISGNIIKGLSGWFADSEFQVYAQIRSDSFILTTGSSDSLVAAFAADVNRCSMAAFESALQIQPTRYFPKSLGWLVIQSYYSAFFAAHSLLRVLGTGFAQLDRQQARAVTTIADLFGMANGTSVEAGYYKCTYDSAYNSLKCEKANSTGGGVHEAFWSVFYNRVRELSTDVLSSKTGVTKDNQIVGVKLAELAENLSYSSFSSGNWLSHIRNIVNYNQRLSVWFPYSGQLAYVKQLFKSQKTWLQDAMTINLSLHGHQDLMRFQQTCNFLIAMCREIALDMSNRCPTGRSFHYFGSVALLNLMKQRLAIPNDTST